MIISQSITQRGQEIWDDGNEIDWLIPSPSTDTSGQRQTGHSPGPDILSDQELDQVGGQDMAGYWLSSVFLRLFVDRDGVANHSARFD